MPEPSADATSTDEPPASGTRRIVRQPRFHGALPDDLRSQTVFVNLDGDYSYLSDGYFRSLEAEHEGLVAIPTPQDALDAYVVPLALTKAAAAGLATPPWEIINDLTVSSPPPLIIYPINPYMDEGQVVSERSGLSEAVKSLSMSGKYAMVCQEMPQDSRVDTLRLVLGQCLKPEYRDFAQRLWETFRLPLARVRVIVTGSDFLFSAISPLQREELTQNEKAIVKEAGLWRA